MHLLEPIAGRMMRRQFADYHETAPQRRGTRAGPPLEGINQPPATRHRRDERVEPGPCFAETRRNWTWASRNPAPGGKATHASHLEPPCRRQGREREGFCIGPRLMRRSFAATPAWGCVASGHTWWLVDCRCRGDRLTRASRRARARRPHRWQTSGAVHASRQARASRRSEVVDDAIPTCEEAPGGTTAMTLRNRGEPAAFANVAARMMVLAVARANRKTRSCARRSSSGSRATDPTA